MLGRGTCGPYGLVLELAMCSRLPGVIGLKFATQEKKASGTVTEQRCSELVSLSDAQLYFISQYVRKIYLG